jgi:hypothetical protein
MRARTYSMAEVKGIFLESEGQEPPAGTGWKKQEHAGDHVNRGNVRLAEDAEGHLRRNPLSAKSSFLTFEELVRVATELLNSPEGQVKLRELDEHGPGSKVNIGTDVGAPVRVHFNMSGMKDDTRLIPWTRFVLLVGATGTGIYLHTCYADMIVR